MKPVIFLPNAMEDLLQIEEPLFAKVVSNLELLSEFPSLGSPMEEPFQGYRAMFIVLFRVIYRELPTRIEVAYIRHCKRQLP